MKLISVIVFYSEKPVKLARKAKTEVAPGATGPDPELSYSLLRLKYGPGSLRGKSQSDPEWDKNRAKRKRFTKELLLESGGGPEFQFNYFPEEEEPVIAPSPPIQLKSQCCEKYLKDKRCRRCPCFDLPLGPASRED